ncbi:hypothetical protein KSD_57000 [Ktedonobacter sp. SOSP1-85]|nr:hypothetical protein KSD_57000 [Ktedonobacter sp. SOSP1-85]
MCSTMVNTATQTTATSSTTQTTSTQAPVTPTPTQKPKPTPTPKPTQSPAQIKAAYKAKTANTTVTNIDKMGNGYKDKDLHFTAVIDNFVKDSDGNTAGANVSDTDSGSSSVIQIGFAPGTDLTKINQGDTVEVWGRDIGVSSGKNAFGGDVQEAGVAVAFITDQTTGYQK